MRGDAGRRTESSPTTTGCRHRLRTVLDVDVEAFNRAVREADLPAVLTEAVAAGR